MLTMVLLKFVGFTALGLLIAVIVVPLIFHLSKIMTYALALVVVLLRATLTSKLTLKKAFKTFPKLLKALPKYMNEPVYEGDSTKGKIRLPKPIYDAYDGGGIIIATVGQTRTPQKPTDSSSYTDNQNRHGLVEQPTIKKLSNFTLHIFHRVISFYRSYYGHSTKVEKNRYMRDIDKRRPAVIINPSYFGKFLNLPIDKIDI